MPCLSQMAGHLAKSSRGYNLPPQAFADGDSASTSPLGAWVQVLKSDEMRGIRPSSRMCVVARDRHSSTAASATCRPCCRPGAHTAARRGQVSESHTPAQRHEVLISRGMLILHLRCSKPCMLAVVRLRRLGDAMLRNGENACYNVYVESRGAVMDKALQVRAPVNNRQQNRLQHIDGAYGGCSYAQCQA